MRLSYALRGLRRSPGFTAVALLSLTLGIGANTAVFTLTNAIFLHPLPVAEPDRLLSLFTVDHATRSAIGNLTRTGISLPNVIDIQHDNEVFSGVAAYAGAGPTLTGFGRPSQQPAWAVTANYFQVLGVRPEAGRTFDPAGDLEGSAVPEAVLSHDLAVRLFGEPRAAVGKTLNLNAIAWTVIGVTPPGFRGTLTTGPAAPIFLPLAMHSRIFSGPTERLYNERRFRFLNPFGRLRPGTTELQALANLRTLAARLETAWPRDNKGRSFEEAPLSEAAVALGPRNQTLAGTLALTLAVGFVLLIACANLANLSLARAAGRAREMGIRVALGAPRRALIRQLLTESALLSAFGGLLGLALGWFGARLLWASRPGFLQNTYIDLILDTRVLAFSLGLAALSCLLFGVLPVIRASAPDVSRLLNAAGRGGVSGGGRSPLRQALVAAEIALALVALVGAGLFVRSMRNAREIDLGFDSGNLFVAGFNVASVQMDPERGREFSRALIRKVAALPGVTSAALADAAPLGVGLVQTAFREGDPVDPKLGVLTPTPPVTPGYFGTLRLPFVEGRDFNDYDRLGATRVIIVSQAMARQEWPGQSALGKRLRFATSPDLWQVVGVVRDHAVLSIGEPPQPVTYLPFDQAWQAAAVLHVRTSGPPERITPAVTAALASLNSELALLNPGTVRQVIDQALWAPGMAALLFGVLGLLAMALAVVGVYGVMAYSVARRRTEIGLRMAIGARPRNVVGMVLGDSARLAAFGIAVGLAAAFALTKSLASLLYGIGPNDPATFAAVATLLALTALTAGAIPAWRASRIDPVAALRGD